MNSVFQPIKTQSLKELFVAKMEQLILSGKLKYLEKLPSERVLAEKMGVSRPVVHEGLRELAAMGLVTMAPRKRTMVNDYRQHGSLQLLNSWIHHNHDAMAPQILDSLMELRVIIEVANARIAAKNRKNIHVKTLWELVHKEIQCQQNHNRCLAELDFLFHHQIALATGNAVSPLLLNSFKQIYTANSCKFFSLPDVVCSVRAFHHKLVQAISDRNEQKAARVMEQMLIHGHEQMRDITPPSERTSP